MGRTGEVKARRGEGNRSSPRRGGKKERTEGGCTKRGGALSALLACVCVHAFVLVNSRLLCVYLAGPAVSTFVFSDNIAGFWCVESWNWVFKLCNVREAQ